MVFTSIPAAYLDAANWQQQVNIISKGFNLIWFLLLFLCPKGKIIQKIKRKNNILATFIYTSS